MTIDVSVLTQYISYLVMIVGIMAGLVSVITQVIKEFPGLDNIPTNAVVIVLSLLLCPVAFLAFCSWKSIAVQAYMIFAVVIASFFVALVAMDGWDKVYEIWDKVKSPKEIN